MKGVVAAGCSARGGSCWGGSTGAGSACCGGGGACVRGWGGGAAARRRTVSIQRRRACGSASSKRTEWPLLPRSLTMKPVPVNVSDTAAPGTHSGAGAAAVPAHASVLAGAPAGVKVSTVGRSTTRHGRGCALGGLLTRTTAVSTGATSGGAPCRRSRVRPVTRSWSPAGGILGEKRERKGKKKKKKKKKGKATVRLKLKKGKRET